MYLYHIQPLWTVNTSVKKKKVQSVSVFGTWFVNILLTWTVQIIQRQLKEQLYCSVVCACAQFREQICEVEVCPKWSRQLAVDTNGFWPPGRGLTAPGDWKIKREVSTYCLTTLCKIFSLWEKETVCGCLSGKTDHLSFVVPRFTAQLNSLHPSFVYEDASHVSNGIPSPFLCCFEPFLAPIPRLWNTPILTHKHLATVGSSMCSTNGWDSNSFNVLTDVF